MNKDLTVLIVGAGIAGLAAAHVLSKKNVKIVIIEQSAEVGGQAKSAYTPECFPTEHSLRVIHKNYKYFYKILNDLKSEKIVDEQFNLVSFDLRAAYLDEDVFFKQHSSGQHRFSKKIILNIKIFLMLLRKKLKIREFFLLVKFISFRFVPNKWLIKYYDTVNTERFFKLAGCSKIWFKTAFKIAQIGGAVKAWSSGILALKLFHIGQDMITDIHNTKMFNGPSSEALFNRWQKSLTKKGVTFILNKKVTSLKLDNHKIDCILTDDADVFKFDYCILATDYRATRSILEKSELLEKISLNTHILDQSFENSSGMQFYLSSLPQPATIFYPGLATVYLESSWSLVSVIQGVGFWKDWEHREPKLYIFSVTYSNCFEKGIFNKKTFFNCTPEEIKKEVLAQCGISDYRIVKAWHLEPPLFLFVPRPGYYQIAPKAVTSIANLYLAGEYCSTHFIVPTMEKAAESGFHAANAVIKNFIKN